MANEKTVPVRTYKCEACGDESDWSLGAVPSEYICLCGGEMKETATSKKGGTKGELT